MHSHLRRSPRADDLERRSIPSTVAFRRSGLRRQHAAESSTENERYEEIIVSGYRSVPGVGGVPRARLGIGWAIFGLRKLQIREWVRVERGKWEAETSDRGAGLANTPWARGRGRASGMGGRGSRVEKIPDRGRGL